MSKGWRIFWKTILFVLLGAFLNIFGLIAWLIIFFFWKGDDDYQKLYYKDACEKQKHEKVKNPNSCYNPHKKIGGF